MRRFLTISTLVLGGLLALLGPRTGHARPAVDVERLREDVRSIIEDEGIPGVGMALVTQDGVVWAGGVGLANREQARPMDADTCFRVGSISKSFVALASLRLAARGVLDLNAPIHHYAPDIAAENPWKHEAPVTVAHALEHTAGFDDMRFNESGSADTPELSVADGLALNPRSRTSRWRPGDRMAYANPGTTVAARVIEHVTGEQFEAVVEREVLAPLGIAPAGYRRTAELDACLAQGYGADGVTPVPYWVTPHRPAGHLTMSPRQLAKMVHMLVRRGEGLLPQASIDRMERSDTRERAIDGLAYGLANYGDFSLPSPARGHDGGMPGFISEYRYFPRLGVGWVLLYNTTSTNLGIAHFRIRRRVFAALTRGMQVTAPRRHHATQAELAAWIGSYELTSPRHEIFGFIERTLMALRIEQRDGGLFLELGAGPTIPLVSAGPDRLSIPGFSGPMLARYPDGTLLLGDATYERRSAVWMGTRQWAITWSVRIVMVAPLLLLLAITLGRRRGATGVLIWPTAAVACLWLLAWSFVQAASGEHLGSPHPWTVLFFASTLLVPASAGISVARSIRGARRRASASALATALVLSAACFVLALWLRSGHIIGLRPWAW